MKNISKTLLATGLSVGMIVGVTSAVSHSTEAQAASTQSQTPYYKYNGQFNIPNNNALEDKNFYAGLMADQFIFNGLKVGQSTKADVFKALGSDFKKYYGKKDLTFFEKNGVIVGFDHNNKLVNLTLRINHIKNSTTSIEQHVKKGEVYNTKTTEVAFYPGNSIVIKAK
ncbi:immunodominant staphylococcal antigen IsaB family protein [Staphylococcus agnetis]|uniref:immunodominant staphylococcal antigen IsaB family protein n=1 Tax=Staphylococcus agnetis TaxID=985762 RepID=UPI000D1A77E0|nr:hypothetical protein [Staphylococcus agnetis]NJH86021.1 hypothetical protein [Staphylococcus agnetis]NJI14831.1 hypothetical protein [Staphylococcus agnetis]PTH37735.1 hypothetical protein BU588_11870 [Staphylococcus agnetis]